jgi:hypothetical protein
MPISTDVTLPNHVKPVFPDKCIVCLSKPDSTTKIAQNSQNWLLNAIFLPMFAPILVFFGWSRVEAPICRGCKWRFGLQRWGRRLIGLTLVIAAAWWFLPDFAAWSPLFRRRFFKRLARLAWATLFAVPYVLVEVFRPRIFTTDAHGDKVDYKFASAEYAAEFQALNAANVVGSG